MNSVITSIKLPQQGHKEQAFVTYADGTTGLKPVSELVEEMYMSYISGQNTPPPFQPQLLQMGSYTYVSGTSTAWTNSLYYQWYIPSLAELGYSNTSHKIEGKIYAFLQQQGGGQGEYGIIDGTTGNLVENSVTATNFTTGMLTHESSKWFDVSGLSSVKPSIRRTAGSRVYLRPGTLLVLRISEL